MRQINNYINEKLIIDKNIDNTERLVINLCNRLVENDNMVDDEFKKQLSAWIFKNKVKDLDRDIFYTISNEDKILDTIKDTSYIKSASKLNTVSDIINKYKLKYLIDSYYKKYSSTFESLYFDDNKLIFLKKSRNSLKYGIYMNAWINEKV